MDSSKSFNKDYPDITWREIIDFIVKYEFVPLMKYVVTGTSTVYFTKEAYKEISQYMPYIAACIRAERIGGSASRSFMSKLLEGGSKSVVKETAEETVATTTKLLNRAKDGAKGGLKAGLVIESFTLSYNLLLTYNKYDRGELSKEEFHRQVLKHGSSSAGSVLGGAAGAAIGTALFPGIGTFAGYVLGGTVGGIVGSLIAS